MSISPITTLAGVRPSPRKLAFDDWGRTARNAFIAAFDALTYSVTYYVSAAGSDANDGLSTSTPKLTFAGARTAAVAYLTANPTLRAKILLRRGDRFDSSTDYIDGVFTSTQIVHVGAYGAGLRPVRSAFHRKVTSGWTNANLSRYTRTEATAVGWVREQGRRLTRAYTLVSSAGAVEATQYSWWYSGTTLHINAGSGVDPNTVPLEIATTNGASGGYRGIALYADESRVSDIVFEGFGIGDGSGAYPVTILPSVGATILCDNVAAYYGPNHVIGQITGGVQGGGTGVFVNIETGYCCTNGSTNFISFNNGGGQKTYVWGHAANYGQAPSYLWVTSTVTKSGQSSYCHTPAYPVVIGEMLVWDEVVKTTNTWGPNVGFGVSPDVTIATAVSDCTIVYTDTIIEYADGAMCLPPGQGVCFRRGRHFLKPYASIYGNGYAATKGWALKTVRTVDLTLQTAATAVDWQTTNSATSSVTFEGCHLSYKIPITSAIHLLANFENALGAMGNKLISSIVSLDQRRGTTEAIGLLGNNSASGINHCALYGWDATSGWGTPFGTSNGSGTVSLYDVPTVDFRPTLTSQLYAAGVNASDSDTIDFDNDGRAVVTSTTPDIGPYSGQVEADGTSGTYWTWEGIKNILGTTNAEIVSQLDNLTTDADLARVAADGVIADAYTNRRARLAGHTVPLTAATTDDYALVQFVTNLYAAYLLVSHREWFADISTDAIEKAILSLEGRAAALYDALFGADPSGIDGPENEPAGTWLDQLRGVKPAPGRTRTACGQAITYLEDGNPLPTTLAGWYELYPELR